MTIENQTQEEFVIPPQQEILRSQIRLATRGTYDLQKMRIQSGNRLGATFRAKLGLKSSDSEDSDAEAKKILDSIRLCYEKMTDGVKVTLKKFKGDGVISTYTEFAIVENYVLLEKAEAEAFKKLKSVVEDHPIWDAFLLGVKGCGHAMAAVIISEFNIYAAKYPSQFHSYAGLDVVIVEEESSGETYGLGRSRRKELMKEVEYYDEEGTLQTRMSLGYNPWLKTKLMGVLADCMIKAKGSYYDVYMNYKHRISNMPAHEKKTPAHRNMMAKRYMIKQFLIDLHMAWREVEGLPVSVPYHEGKLGIVHTQKPERQVIKLGGKPRYYTVEKVEKV